MKTIQCAHSPHHHNGFWQHAGYGRPVAEFIYIYIETFQTFQKGKATAPSGVALEIILALQRHIVPHLTKLANNMSQ